MKKISIFVISILMMIGISSISFAYSDTSEHWAREAIDDMSDKKIVNGYSDGTFKPNNEMTRAEFIAVVNRMLGLKNESSRYIPDISRQDWYYADVRKAVEAGILKGDDTGYIRPNDTITREEAVVVLARAFKIADAIGIDISYSDRSEISDWAKTNVYTFVRYGYLNGYDGNIIRPKSPITRAEALTIIKRIIPNILTENIYKGIIQGNTLLYENNIVLNQVVISGNLIIKEDIIDTLKINNVEVKGNLIIQKQNKNISKIIVGGKIVETYAKEVETDNQYINKEYGISFAIPSTATVVESNKQEKIDFDKEDIIEINILKDDKYYVENILTLANEQVKQYANLFRQKEVGSVKSAEYVLYDDNDNSQMIIIKRENVLYVLAFFNLVSENIVDNILATVELLPTDQITDYNQVMYNNKALSLKFWYKEFYVLVDDSYNTGIRNESDAFFKLFIQVNTVTDMEQYSLREVKELLKSLARNDGDIVKTEELKIINNDAIKFVIKDENRTTDSLYIVVGNNLYNLIFTGETDAMNEVGMELFRKIINTIEI
jgi:hypothetical protein